MVLKKIGLTGATGMLGRHIKFALEKAGSHVIGVSRHAASDCNVVSWDLENWLSMTQLDNLFAGVGAVVHAGAMVPRATDLIDDGRMFNANVRACINLVNWAESRSIPIVHVSGAIVYAEPDRECIVEEAQVGWSGLGGLYGLSKVLAEDVFSRYKKQNLKLALVRPSSIYGHGLAPDKLISRFLSTASQDETITLTHPLDDKIDFIHAADVASAIVAILEVGAWDVFNIASGSRASVREIAQLCIAASGRGRIVFNGLQNGEPSSRFSLNTEKAKILLGWQSTIDICQGLALMLNKSLNIKTVHDLA